MYGQCGIPMMFSVNRHTLCTLYISPLVAAAYCVALHLLRKAAEAGARVPSGPLTMGRDIACTWGQYRRLAERCMVLQNNVEVRF
jgi:hypothetical protein